MIRGGFLTAEERQDLTELARDGLAEHRLARRANALVLLDRGMSCEEVGRVLLIDDDTIRTWHCLFQEDGIDGLAGFTYGGRASQLTLEQQDDAEGVGRRNLAPDDPRGRSVDRAGVRDRLREQLRVDRALASSGTGTPQAPGGVAASSTWPNGRPSSTPTRAARETENSSAKSLIE